MHSRKPEITLITGGSRSGKSSHALVLANAFSQKTFIATAEALDEEMKLRIKNHQIERDNDFLTIEEPVKLAEAVARAGKNTDIIVLDCLTVWLGNLQYHLESDDKIDQEIQNFLDLLKDPPCSLIIVTNEVGMGIIPENELSRKFRDAAGFLNQQVARIADRVILTISGIPMKVK